MMAETERGSGERRNLEKRMTNNDEQNERMPRDDPEQKQEDGKGVVMEKIKMGVRRFLKDLVTPRHIAYKMIYFTLLAGVVIVWPQFTVHQSEIGLTVAQTGICTAVVSGLSIVIPFISGAMGDKMGNYKIMLIISTALVAVTAFLFSVVPSARVPSTSTNYTTTIFAITTVSTIDLSTSASSTASSLDPVDDDLLLITFWSYLGVRVSFGVLQAVSYTLFEAAVMAEVQANGLDYGFQRAWGTLAVVGASFLSGYLVELTSGFNILFYVSTSLHVVAAALMLLLRLEFKPPATSLAANIWRHTINTEVLMFFTAMLAAGVFFGFLETYMYRYLTSLGASPVLVGLTVTVGAPFEMVLTLLASFLVPLIGHVTIIIFGLFAHSVRLLGFSLLVDPWWVLPFEVLESVSNGLLLTVGCMYCTVLFPLESIASFRGIFAVVYFGVGQLIGALSGSYLMEAFGDRGAFRALAWVALGCAFAYATAYYAYRRCKRQGEADACTEQDGENKLPEQPVIPYQRANKHGIDNEAWVGDEE